MHGRWEMARINDSSFVYRRRAVVTVRMRMRLIMLNRSVECFTFIFPGIHHANQLASFIEYDDSTADSHECALRYRLPGESEANVPNSSLGYGVFIDHENLVALLVSYSRGFVFHYAHVDSSCSDSLPVCSNLLAI